MEEQMESGGTFEEPGESASVESLASRSDASGASREELRQPISLPLSNLESQIRALNAHIEETIERKFQKGKDKRFARMEDDISALHKEITELRVKQTQADSLPTESPELVIPQGKASHVIQPSGGGLPAPDLRREYEHRLGALRPGDVAGLMELKREFRKRGLEVY